MVETKVITPGLIGVCLANCGKRAGNKVMTSDKKRQTVSMA